MKRLVRVQPAIPWLPKPGEGRLFLTDELPPREHCATAFGFVFAGKRMLMTRLRLRGWDIPGGTIEPGESPQETAVREIFEETGVGVEVVDLIGVQELALFGPRPEEYRWPYPLSVQIFFRCRVLDAGTFAANSESTKRRFLPPWRLRRIRTMKNHRELFEEALRRQGAASSGGLVT